MSDLNNLGNLSMQNLQQYDFSQKTDLVDNKTMDDLLKNEGVFSLDDSGKVVVISSQKKLHNSFFRFIGGLFSSSYKNEQNTIERSRILKNNASFNKILRDQIIKLQESKTGSTEFAKSKANMLTSCIENLFSKNEEITTDKINKTIKSYSKATQKIGMRSTATMTASETGNGILFKGQNMSPTAFMKILIKKEGAPELDGTMLGSSIMSRALRNPDAFACIGKQQEAQNIRNLVFQGKVSEEQETEILNNLCSILSEIKNRMTSSAMSALENGKDPVAVASKLEYIYQKLSDKFDSANEDQQDTVQKMMNLLTDNTSLIDAADKTAYKQIPKELEESYSKLKQELPSLSDKQLGCVISMLTDDGTKTLKVKNVENYIKAVKQEYSNYKDLMFELNQVIHRGESISVPQRMNQLKDLVERINGGPIQDKETISNIIRPLVHYMAITETSEALGSLDINAIGHLYNQTLDAIENKIPTEVDVDEGPYYQNLNNTLSTFVVLSEQIGMFIKPLTSNGTGGIDIVPNDAESSAKAEKTIDDLLIIESMNSPDNKELIDYAVGFFPERAQKNARNLLTLLLRGDAVKCNSIEEFNSKIKDRLTVYTSQLTKYPKLADALDESGFTKENLQNMFKFMFEGEHSEMKKSFLEEVQNNKFRPDGMHEDCPQDINRIMLRKINGNDLAYVDGNNRFNTANQMLDELKVQKDFKKFLSLYTMQGGLSAMIATSLMAPAGASLNDKLPSMAEAEESGVFGYEPLFEHDISVKNGILTIKSNCRIETQLADKKNMPDNLPHKGGIVIHDGMQFTIQIDMNQGVDKDGYPKSIKYLSDESVA